MRDHVGLTSPAYADLAATRPVVTELAALFADRGVRATWATVGFLFASSADEISAHRPAVRPRYSRGELDPYGEPVADDESVDPEHLAGSLVRELAATTGQEVASHTFSHFYCLEDGSDEASLRADLAAAQSIAGRFGLVLTSLVLPRNQWNPRYARAIRESGFNCFRGPQPGRGHQPEAQNDHTAADRVARLIDSYGGLTPPPTVAWDQVPRSDGLCDIPASAFLRPYSPRRRALEELKRRRLVSGLRDAARRGRIFHLWWHPHNFARYPVENFTLLQRLLDEFGRLSHNEGMVSLSMRDAAAFVQEPQDSGLSPVDDHTGDG